MNAVQEIHRPPMQVSRKFSLLLIAFLLSPAAAIVPAYFWMRGLADDQDRRNEATALFIGFTNYDDIFRRLPRDTRAPDGELATSWRVDMMPFLYAVKHDWDREQPWTAEVNSYWRGFAHEYYCGETTNARVFLMAKEETSDGSADSRSLGDLFPETLLFLETPRDSDIHWMEPRDLTLDEALSPAMCLPGEYVFATFADGQIWKLTAESKNDLRRFLEPEPGLPENERQRVLSRFGRWMNPPNG